MTRLSTEGSQPKTLRNVSGAVIGLEQKAQQAVADLEKKAEELLTIDEKKEADSQREPSQ